MHVGVMEKEFNAFYTPARVKSFQKTLFSHTRSNQLSSVNSLPPSAASNPSSKTRLQPSLQLHDALQNTVGVCPPEQVLSQAPFAHSSSVPLHESTAPSHNNLQLALPEQETVKFAQARVPSQITLQALSPGQLTWVLLQAPVPRHST